MKQLEVVAALIVDKDRFLVGQRPEGKNCAGLWEFMGGKIEAGETPEQALRRECREELDIDVEVGPMRAETEHTYPAVSIHLMLFEARIIDGTPRSLEHSGLKWVTLDTLNIDEFCPADQKLIQSLK